jgi:hypothetical protein
MVRRVAMAGAEASLWRDAIDPNFSGLFVARKQAIAPMNAQNWKFLWLIHTFKFEDPKRAFAFRN